MGMDLLPICFIDDRPYGTRMTKDRKMENKNYKTAERHMVFIMQMKTQFQRSYEIRREKKN